jgi:hypothetical protein
MWYRFSVIYLTYIDDVSDLLAYETNDLSAPWVTCGGGLTIPGTCISIPASTFATSQSTSPLLRPQFRRIRGSPSPYGGSLRKVVTAAKPVKLVISLDLMRWALSFAEHD